MHPRAAAARTALLLILAAAAAGCTAAGGLTSRRDTPPAGVQSSVRVVLSAPAGAAPRLEATLVDALGERRVGPGDLRASADLPSPHSAWVAAASSGTLELRVALAGGAGETLGMGALSLPLEAGSSWSVEALVHRPAAGIPPPPCLGCGAETRVALRPSASAGIAAGDSLFLRAARIPAAGRPPPPPS